MVKVVSDSVHRQLTDDDTSPARPPAKSLPGGHFFALTPQRTAPEGAASKHHRKSSLLARDRRGGSFSCFPPSEPAATHAAIMQPDQGPRHPSHERSLSPSPAGPGPARPLREEIRAEPPRAPANIRSAHRLAAAHAAGAWIRVSTRAPARGNARRGGRCFGGRETDRNSTQRMR